jgi:chromosomal replication initiation ATPase DnaA
MASKLAAQSAPIELYAEKNIWSQHHAAWKRFYVRKPRLPVPEDEESRWAEDMKYRPPSFSLFIGRHNDELIKTLRNLQESFDSSKQLPSSIIIHGAPGSGKTSMIKIFVNELAEEMRMSPAQMAKWALYLDAKTMPDVAVLWNRITKFSEPNFERFIQCSFRLIILDNADIITPSQQQGRNYHIKVLYTTTITPWRITYVACTYTAVRRFKEMHGTVCD